MQLSIIIPTKERDDIFIKTLIAAIDATRHLETEIIVVNDSKLSKPPSLKNAFNVTIIDNPKPGVASARNEGAKRSTGNLLLFLDNDIVISKDTVDRTMALHGQYKNAGFNLNWKYPDDLQGLIEKSSFGRFLQSNGLTSFKGWYSDPSWRDDALFRSLSLASFHLSITRTDFERSGGYDEQFPYAGFEDYDFPDRLKKLAIDFYIDASISVEHNESDRLKLENWLMNQERRATTRKVAVSRGYRELHLHYSAFKSLILMLIIFLNPVFQGIFKIFPNHKFFDPLYSRLLKIVLAGRIYKGYNSI